MKVFGITGWKNAGKTGLMERLVTDITARGLSVSTIKHAHHSFDVDQPGRDSFRHRAAGAQEVLLASAHRVALMQELRGAPEPSLDQLLARMSPVDLILIEGYKRSPHPKVEAVRAINNHPLLAKDDSTIRAIACDDAPDLDKTAFNGAVFNLNDTAAIAGFILSEVGL
ncbi:molybdopterin-guanine dinucleotide biosynthesis protein B [Roseovarius aestuarii]|nr:molybdopterin-guanine dinucleotide biosynthesis protein B [Roseovarius aestuarii]